MKQVEKNKLINIIVEVLEINKSQLSETIDLTNLGMDSINFIYMIVKIEEEFAIEIPDEFLVLSKMNKLVKIEQVITYCFGRT